MALFCQFGLATPEMVAEEHEFLSHNHVQKRCEWQVTTRALQIVTDLVAPLPPA